MSSPTVIYTMPDDKVEALQILLSSIAAAKTTIRVFMYAFTHKDLIDALIAAHKRGVDVRLIIDHSESTTPTEVAMLHRLVLNIPPHNICVCTSTELAIMHLKVMIVDKETVFEGSLNWSESAFRQMNTLCVTSDAPYASTWHDMFDAQVQWALQREALYQPPDPPDVLNGSVIPPIV